MRLEPALCLGRSVSRIRGQHWDATWVRAPAQGQLQTCLPNAPKYSRVSWLVRRAVEALPPNSSSFKAVWVQNSCNRCKALHTCGPFPCWGQQGSWHRWFAVMFWIPKVTYPAFSKKWVTIVSFFSVMNFS